LLSVSPTNSEKRTVLHVQDYNRAVLELVTLPNLVLAALPFLPAESLRPLEDAADVESVLPDLNQPGDLISRLGLSKPSMNCWKDKVYNCASAMVLGPGLPEI